MLDRCLHYLLVCDAFLATLSADNLCLSYASCRSTVLSQHRGSLMIACQLSASCLQVDTYDLRSKNVFDIIASPR